MGLKAKCGLLILLVLSLIFCGHVWADESDLIWSTYLGGGHQDFGDGIALDKTGHVYVLGRTQSFDFPTTTGAFDTTLNDDEKWWDVFVAKLSPTGNILVYATLLGGNLSDEARDIAVDGSDNAYVTGTTWSSDFPTTPEAFDTSHNGSGDYAGDVFVTKLNAAGSALIYSTFLGGSDSDRGCGIAVDDSSHVYVSGWTRSAEFPTTAGAFDTSYNGNGDVFVAKLDPTGSNLEYATFLGSSHSDGGRDIVLDDCGNAYVTGHTWADDFPTTSGAYDTTYHGGYGDAFVTKLNQTGRELIYSTILGGSDEDDVESIALDDAGNAYVTGWTMSWDWPITAEAFDTTNHGWFGWPGDAFVTKLNPTGSALVYSTFLGESGYDHAYGIAVNGSGNAYVVGHTDSRDSLNFPTTNGAFDTTHNGHLDVFVTKLNPAGRALVYSTFLGGGEQDRCYGIGLDGSDNVYLIGHTYSDNFPTTVEAFDATYDGLRDVFVAKFSLGGTPVESETPLAELPEAYALHQNYPNPFNANTEIRYQVPVDGRVTLKVFNTLGQEVRTLVDTDQEAGSHTISWDCRDSSGREVASGVYFCRLNASDFSKTIKMVFLK